MKKRIMIYPSLLSADFSKIAEEIRIVENAGVAGIHLDIMDGHFVPNLTIGPMVVESIRKITRLPLWSHLMIEKPDKFIKAFGEAGSNGLYVHEETSDLFHSLLDSIHELGMQTGAVVNPESDCSKIKPYLGNLDRILIMTVHPGFGGQKFIVGQIEKIKEMRRMIDQSDYQVLIEVDGGINLETTQSVVEAGADSLVIGSAIYHAPDPGQMVHDIQKIAAGVL